MILEIILAVYLLMAFAAFLRGNFTRTLALRRGDPDLADSQVAVHEALWEVRKKFEPLFVDDTARAKALKLFPSLNELTEDVTEIRPTNVPGYSKIIGEALVWPLSYPIKMTNAAAANVAEAERKERRAQVESYHLLAEHETDPELREAYYSCDPDRVLAAVMAKGAQEVKTGSPLAIENPPEPLLDLTANQRVAEGAFGKFSKFHTGVG